MNFEQSKKILGTFIENVPIFIMVIRVKSLDGAQTHVKIVVYQRRAMYAL